MGVGDTGDHLKPYEQCDFYVSMDAGLTWTKARDGPHKYEFGDQGGILVAIKDEEKANKIWYSFNYGKSWNDFDLGMEIAPAFLTTLPDSTSERFVLLGKKSNGEFVLFSLEFDGMRSRKCNLDKKGDGGDFEKWYARYDEDGSSPPYYANYS
jgi:Sortilin, neurotensin receptor 3,/Sortilin, neurotensin receptor 3, C-terminal